LQEDSNLTKNLPLYLNNPLITMGTVYSNDSVEKVHNVYGFSKFGLLKEAGNKGKPIQMLRFCT